jgi:hypothetical protein
MAKYFKNFPKTIYNLGDTTSLDTITNITTSFSFGPDILENSVAYYEYSIQDGETPEMIAHKVYKSAEKHWIILKVNNIFDVKSEWPMDDSSLKKYLSIKYANTAIQDLSYFVSEDNQRITTENSEALISEDSILLSGFQWAYNNTHSYYKIETTRFVGTNETYSDTTQITEEEYNSISTGTTSITLSDGKVIEVTLEKTYKTYYEYEKELNEKKRSIKILKPEFGYTVQTELESFMNG